MTVTDRQSNRSLISEPKNRSHLDQDPRGMRIAIWELLDDLGVSFLGLIDI